MSDNLLVFIDVSNKGGKNDERATEGWPWVYADGKFQSDYDYDIVLFNQPEPTADGYYLAFAPNNKAVIINLVADEFGRIRGRCCYIDDYESLKHINSPEQWR